MPRNVRLRRPWESVYRHSVGNQEYFQAELKTSTLIRKLRFRLITEELLLITQELFMSKLTFALVTEVVSVTETLRAELLRTRW